MQRFLSIALALCIGLTLSLDANAKRFGGGGRHADPPRANAGHKLGARTLASTGYEVAGAGGVPATSWSTCASATDSTGRRRAA